MPEIKHSHWHSLYSAAMSKSGIRASETSLCLKSVTQLQCIKGATVKLSLTWLMLSHGSSMAFGADNFANHKYQSFSLIFMADGRRLSAAALFRQMLTDRTPLLNLLWLREKVLHLVQTLGKSSAPAHAPSPCTAPLKSALHGNIQGPMGISKALPFSLCSSPTSLPQQLKPPMAQGETCHNFCCFSPDREGTCDFWHYCDKQLWFIHSSRRSIIRFGFFGKHSNTLFTDRAVLHLSKAKSLSEVRSQLHMPSTTDHVAVHWAYSQTYKISLFIAREISNAWLSIY